MFDLTLAQIKVSSMENAEGWYRRVLGSGPDTRPMSGLIEWRLGLGHGVQVFHDPNAAGRSAVVLGAPDFEATIARLDAEGIAHGGIRPGGGGRLVELSDPDGNQVVILDGRAAHDRPKSDIVATTLRFRRTLAAPVARVWTAYADVEQRCAWAVPEGEEVVYDASEFTDGGTDHYRCGPAGELDNHVSTRYLRVEGPHAFVAVNELRRSGTTVAVDTTHWRLDPDADTTGLSVDVQVTSLAGPGVLDGYHAGHERTLDHLERFLA